MPQDTVTGTVQPDAVNAVKPSTTATMTLLLKRDITLPPSPKGQSVARRPDSVARDGDSVSRRGAYWIDFNRKFTASFRPDAGAASEASEWFAGWSRSAAFDTKTGQFTECFAAQRISELTW